jgi:predicted RNA binding protein YcfA (HicA-like mRNA interferase family)
MTYAGGLLFTCIPHYAEPAGPSGTGGAASSALSLGLDDVPASPAASLLASEAAALGAYITVIAERSTKYPKLSGEEIIKILQKMGFSQARQRGSHVVMKKLTPDGMAGCVVPIHKEVAAGTLNGILKQAHLTPEEFFSHQ